MSIKKLLYYLIPNSLLTNLKHYLIPPPNYQVVQQLVSKAKIEGWKRLNLGNYELTDLETQIPELFELTELEELILTNDQEWDDKAQEWWYNDSKNKGNYNCLNKLPLSISKLKRLKVLYCSGEYRYNWGIVDYSAVQYLPNLVYLELSFNQITEIIDLDSLPNLQSLILSHNQITQVTYSKKLFNLKELYIINNPIAEPIVHYI